MADPAVIAAERVFDGERFTPTAPWRSTTVGSSISSTPPATRTRSGCRRGAVLAPGFIDAQVNGGGGVLLNDEPTVDGIGRIAAAHRRFGTTALLPTLISDRRDVMRRAIRAVGDAIEAGVPGVVGIHLEGPFLNPERKGVHPAGPPRPGRGGRRRARLGPRLPRRHAGDARPRARPARLRRRSRPPRRRRLRRAHGRQGGRPPSPPSTRA